MFSRHYFFHLAALISENYRGINEMQQLHDFPKIVLKNGEVKEKAIDLSPAFTHSSIPLTLQYFVVHEEVLLNESAS